LPQYLCRALEQELHNEATKERRTDHEVPLSFPLGFFVPWLFDCLGLSFSATAAEFATASWSAAGLRRFVTPPTTRSKWQGNDWQGNEDSGLHSIPRSIIPLPKYLLEALS
jgi:hypothetical protein